MYGVAISFHHFWTCRQLLLSCVANVGEAVIDREAFQDTNCIVDVHIDRRARHFRVAGI